MAIKSAFSGLFFASAILLSTPALAVPIAAVDVANAPTVAIIKPKPKVGNSG